MQIVIDIQDEIKDMCDNARPEKAMKGIEWFNGTLYKAIKDGIVLPKGHGRLIDENDLVKNLFDYVNGKRTIGECLDRTKTVVPAD